MTKYEYFERPTQIRFWDYDGNHWIGGIAYGSEIICGCCGGIFTLAEVYEYAPEEIEEPIYVYHDWLDLSDTIIADDYDVED